MRSSTTGTLVGYLGDGLLACSGRPFRSMTTQIGRLRPAREMLTVRLPRFNRRVRERTLGNGFEMGSASTADCSLPETWARPVGSGIQV